MYARTDYQPKFNYWEELLTSLFLNTQFLGVWNLIYFFYHYIQKSQKQEIERIRLEGELKMQQLQIENTTLQFQKDIADASLSVLRSQMNPHFIFNSLNSIQKYIWENKQEDASEYLTKFARLMRTILENSGTKMVTLESELNALNLYVELEHRRSNNKFDYEIHTGDCLDPSSILLPSLLLQPYVENAIWHGLLPKEDRGFLHIGIFPNGNELLKCVIEDNGVGRLANVSERAIEQTNASYGMQLTKQRIEMTEANGHTGSVVVEDITGKSTGTRVIINLPLNSFIKI